MLALWKAALSRITVWPGFKIRVKNCSKKGEEFIQKETERILRLIKPDVLPSESTYQCKSGNRLMPQAMQTIEPPLDKEDAQS
ncbi:hypothetical protein [Wolbachia endosymbiont of Mansonella ozzardi]|uniref:hypothetical protein n=1 Tax=Wolbachia endosymbiont of Mansonella ozzardi TaxID=137464 RepID=UPI001CE1FA92|nr:hypothetical protein [Wolbachia endosymbiont of Mansonella ozzardi]